MAKERLSISKVFRHKDKTSLPVREYEYRVGVGYEFVNKSGKDIRTEVAFPLPAYSYPYEDLNGVRRIGGFKAEADGKPISYKTETRALADGRDVTGILRSLGVDAASFANYDHITNKSQLSSLPEADLAKLKAVGAVSVDVPKWKISVIHHWSQTFPAGRTLKVSHEYNAIPGFSYGYDARLYLNELSKENAGCFDDKLVEQLKKSFPNGVRAEWVKYILTTANTWETPIRDFELTVEYPAGQFASFCWDGNVRQVSPTKLRAVSRDFIPQKELVVYFFSGL